MMKLPPELILDLLQTQPTTRGELSKWKRKASKAFHLPMISNQALLQGLRTSPIHNPSSPPLTLRGGTSGAALERLLRVRDVRTLSGVAIVTVLVKPYVCPGQCVYCPTEVRMPKSYIETEPAAQRALRLNFDPFVQMTSRLSVLNRNGHPTDKIELIVKGGTWSAYPKTYQRWFLKECYRAANMFAARGDKEVKRLGDEESDTIKPNSYSEVELLNQGDRTMVETYNKKGGWATGESTEAEILAEEQVNETAGNRIIGLTLETRPDWINEAEIRQLRVLGCTRVELGAQAIDDGILTLIKRGHDVASIARAIALLRDAGFKVDVHMMPQLPGATAQKDVEMFRLLFDDPRFRPDMVKIYPCVVTPSAELYQWWKSGKYTPYSDAELIETLITIKSEIIPRYCRISRLIRDIPSQHIAAGNKVTNLRETVQHIMKKRELQCKCLRCREVGHQQEAGISHRLGRGPARCGGNQESRLFVEEYKASSGTEYFLSIESEDRKVVYAFCRLRIPGNTDQRCHSRTGGNPETIVDPRSRSGMTKEQKDRLLDLLPETRDCAFIRELHTYGQLVPIESSVVKGQSPVNDLRLTPDDLRLAQHTGLGRQLMSKAEEIVKAQGIKKIAVIAGVGVREYYRKLGYALEGTYMIKVV